MENVKSRILKTTKIIQVIVDQQDQITAMAKRLFRVLRTGHTIFFLAGRSSAFIAQHIAAEFVGKFTADRKPLPAVALTEDTTLLSAVGADYGSENILVRQIRTFVKKGDMVVCIAADSRDPGIVSALQLCREQNAGAVAISGRDMGRIGDLVDIVLKIPSRTRPRIEECQLLVCHALYGLIQDEFAHKGDLDQIQDLLRFSCTNCGESIAVMKRFAGRRGTCPHCHANVTVPVLGDAAGEPVETAESRKFMRFSVRDCVLDVVMEREDGYAERFRGHTALEDMSQGGMQFAHYPPVDRESADGRPEPIPIGSQIRFRLNTPAFLDPIMTKGEVLRVTEIPETTGFRYGVKFIKYHKDARENIKQLEQNVVLRNIVRTGTPPPE